MNGPPISGTTERLGPLAGIRVLDFSHFASGPVAAMVLGDLGAEVIKVEPASGDPVRGMGVTFPSGWSTFFLAFGMGSLQERDWQTADGDSEQSSCESVGYGDVTAFENVADCRIGWSIG